MQSHSLVKTDTLLDSARTACYSFLFFRQEVDMKQLTGNQVRQMFLDYFASKGHMIEPGASLVPDNDPTLLWINAGVAALKKYFDGSEKPASNRIANAQKSIRTNDIENVGKTARHHTFFEMLGNFSIGDYFKEEAIPFAWEFLTSQDWMGIDKDRLYVSVYTDDDDAYRIWTEVCGVDPSHILKTDENFWEIGKGPGGPDSEIFFDRGPKYDPEGLGERLFFEELENDRYIEVWNVVFSQFDCDPELDRKEYRELPQKNIDTGMGLERLVALIQDGETNFDTDLFLPIIHAAAELTGVPYEGDSKMAYRVIADHIRTLTFALADGASFSNSGRGYVLRRVLRRAARFGLKLGMNEPFLYKLVPVVNSVMEDFYPYLTEHTEQTQRRILKEEQSFRRTLETGQSLLDDAMKEAAGTGRLPGEIVFRLYDTYGFPYELTAEIADENGLTVDRAEFDAQMQQQKERARNARNTEESFATQHEDLMKFEQPSEFIGYDILEFPAKVVGLFREGRLVDSLEDEGQVVLDKCCFYATSGGQVADSGRLFNEEMEAEVTDVTKIRNGQHVLTVKLKDGILETGDDLMQAVDAARRLKTTANHSATHLMQSALKKVLGEHIHQAGSFVGPDYLRFDFSHFEKPTPEQLREVERIVNEYIADRYPVSKEIMDIEDAKKSGATALFNEKYGDKVRVVTMGDVSKEFCAGCHVNNTGEIGVLKIVSEESIGSDARRLTAKTGFAAYEEFAGEDRMLNNIAASARQKSLKKIDDKVAAAYTQIHDLNNEVSDLKNQVFQLKSDQWLSSAKEIAGRPVLIRKVEGMDGREMKNLAAMLKKKDSDMVVFLAADAGGKLVFAAGVGDAAVKAGNNAGQLVRAAAEVTGGKGGGKADLAQAGGRDTAKLDEAFETVASMIR